MPLCLYHRFRHYITGLLCLLLPLLAVAAPPSALDEQALAEVRAMFPRATAVGALEGEYPHAAVYRGTEVLGHVLLTDRIAPIPAYSGKPITALVGFDADRVIRGVRILAHREPILAAGVSEERLHAFVSQYRGLAADGHIKVGGRDRDGYTAIDTISGASITVIVLNASITDSLHKVLDSLGDTAGTATGGVTPLWHQTWRQQKVAVAVLIAALSLLSLILLFQDWLARRPRLLMLVRDGYLVFTVLFIGGYALAQLSIINVFTFTGAMLHDFDWGAFLLDPMMFLLWGFTAVTLLLWGRGVYCGWLCPFGAVQELVNQAGRRIGLRQWEFPEVVHERLWALKYVILLVLFGVSLQADAGIEHYAEVEPFKTLVLRFQREWGYVIYAVALILVSLVNRKFFCKYVCPLGAALAIPARLRLFDWLRRRKECGRPCRTCATECEVRAINEVGEINANECHYCLDCQVTYWNDRKCPPLVEKRKRREKAARAKARMVEMEVPFSQLAKGGRQRVPEDEEQGYL